MLRRRLMMMLAAKSSAKDGSLYPIQSNGNLYLKPRTITITDSIVVITSDRFTKDAYEVKNYVNVSDLSQNTDDIYSADNVTNKQSIFTIPAGAVCKLDVDANFTAKANYEYFNVSLYSDSGTSAVKSIRFPNYMVGDRMMSTEWTQSESVNIGCVAVVLSHFYDNPLTISRIELTVNGERWV